MGGLELFHTGIVVADLDRARASIGPQIGSQWVSVAGPQHVRTPAGDFTHTFCAVFSRVGPPDVELVEGLAGTLWEPGPEPRLHHLGFWAGDLRAEVRRLQEGGGELLARDVTNGEEFQVFAFVRTDEVLMELISAARREPLMTAIRG